ncbi:hypothetical protein [Halocalculus aciditolerans]|uniref:Holliday junction resolvase n=1 Tax=Halocalculus aciditolerans TaxID=1383812 RepID=A0A830F4U4_9EURY|nr:hypothetical protein [Halocalculus aciditolerans]GGL55053.1 hypothetical protein GCM10009039_11420 [Halocalculus aciditolerans]
MSGSRYERGFVRMFSTGEWWAQRAAASGSATDADLPDVTFAHDGIGFAGELKTTSRPTAYVDADEVRALQRYAAAYGMRACLLGRWKGERAYYIWNPNDVERTDGGNYRLNPQDGTHAAIVVEPGAAFAGRRPEDWTGAMLADALAGGDRP